MAKNHGTKQGDNICELCRSSISLGAHICEGCGACLIFERQGFLPILGKILVGLCGLMLACVGALNWLLYPSHGFLKIFIWVPIFMIVGFALIYTKKKSVIWRRYHQVE